MVCNTGLFELASYRHLLALGSSGRITLQIQKALMNVPHTVSGLFLRDGVRSSE